MTDHNKNLIIAPTVIVVGQTTFDMQGMDAFIELNGLNTIENYVGSPIQKLRDLEGAHSEQSEAELMAEFAGRFCYRSWGKGRPSDEYLPNVVEMRHGSVLEHVTLNIVIQGVSRSLTHELIRHRAGFAVSQESQRYVDANDVKWIIPPLLLSQCGHNLDHPRIQQFLQRCETMLGYYVAEQRAYREELEAETDLKAKTLIKKRANEAARSMLPNATETRLTWTGNLRALRHFCELRGDEHADLEIRRLAVAMTEMLMDRAPYTFADTETFEGEYGVGITAVGHTKV